MGWPVAAGEAAVAVSSGDGSPHGFGEEAVLAADVEGLAVGSKDDAAYGGVTGDAGDPCGGEHGAVLGLSERIGERIGVETGMAAGEVVDVDVD